MTAATVIAALTRSGPARAQAPGETEVDFVPIAGGDSDIGFGLGAVGAVTRFTGELGRPRWAWRIEGSVFATARLSPGLEVPYQDHWVLFTLPGLLDGRLRLTARVAFTRENDVRYFGLGDASPAPPDIDAARYLYTRTHPMIEVHALASLPSHLFASLGGSYTLEWLELPPGGRLADDMRVGSPEVRSLLGDARTHGVALAQTAFGWDDRDNEVVTRRGSWDEIDLRLSPGLGGAMPYGYGEILAIARAYVPVGPRVVVAARALGDALFGDPPFYQLALYDETYALGGTAGVRGVPGGRYYGKIKAIANLEVRADVVRFEALHKPWGVDAVAFFDAGRLWADWTPQPALDGTGLGLKWGTGLGLRLEQGHAFVVRGDVAWSPDARPIGGYFAAGEQF